jgi:hypothetical protein
MSSVDGDSSQTSSQEKSQDDEVDEFQLDDDIADTTTRPWWRLVDVQRLQAMYPDMDFHHATFHLDHAGGADRLDEEVLAHEAGRCGPFSVQQPLSGSSNNHQLAASSGAEQANPYKTQHHVDGELARLLSNVAFLCAAVNYDKDALAQARAAFARDIAALCRFAQLGKYFDTLDNPASAHKILAEMTAAAVQGAHAQAATQRRFAPRVRRDTFTDVPPDAEMDSFLELFAAIKGEERQAVLAAEQRKQGRLDGAKSARAVLAEILNDRSFCRTLGGRNGKRIFTQRDVYDGVCTRLKARNVDLEQLGLKHIDLESAGRNGLKEWLPALGTCCEPTRRRIANETKALIGDFLERYTVDVSSSNNLHRQLRSAGGLAGAVRDVIGGMIATGAKSITYDELRKKIYDAADMTDDAESRCVADGVVFGLSEHSNAGGDTRKKFNDVRKKLEAVYVHADGRSWSLQREVGYEHGRNTAGGCKFIRE